MENGNTNLLPDSSMKIDPFHNRKHCHTASRVTFDV